MTRRARTRAAALLLAASLAMGSVATAQAPQEPDAPDAGSQDAGAPGAGAQADAETTPIPPLAIEPEGGPLTLEEDVLEAAAAWRDAGAEGFRVELDEDAADRFAYGDPDLLGPDTVSLTIQRSEAPGVEVRLHPQLVARYPSALAHELGRLAGLALGEEGVLNPALAEDAPGRPSAEDVERWRARADFVPEDLNQDGVVDLYDLAQLAEAYGNRGVRLPEDLDDSGAVDAGDLERLRAAYRFLAPSEQPPDERAAPEPDAADDAEALPDAPEDVDDDDAQPDTGDEAEPLPDAPEDAPDDDAQPDTGDDAGEAADETVEPPEEQADDAEAAPADPDTADP